MSDIGSEHSDTQSVNDSSMELMRDMLKEILAESSVDSLMSYKLISKFWHDLIRDQNFTNLQLKHSNKNQNYIICRCAENSRGTEICSMDNEGQLTAIFSLPQILQGAFLRVVSSFNGLLFITWDMADNELIVLIINPAMRKAHLFPKGSPSAVPPKVGIAFNLENCQYKVFQFFKDLLESEEDCFACEVYAPVTKSWRRIESVKYRPLVTPYSSSNDHICVDGILYWLGCPKEGRRAATGPVCIMSISMHDEIFKTMDFPGCLKLTQFSFLINLEGKLSLVTVDCPKLCIMCQCGPGRPDSPAQAYLYVAEDLVQPTWFLKTSFKIHVDGIYRFKSVVANKSDIFFIIADVKDVLHYHIYHVADSSWTVLDLPQSGYTRSLWVWPVAFPFAESLCPCGGNNHS